MRKKWKKSQGILIYRKQGGTVSNREGTDWLLLCLRVLAVALVAEAFWLELASVFELGIDIGALFICLLAVSAACALILMLPGKRYSIPAGVVLVFLYVWIKKEFLINGLNHLANAYLKFHYEGEEVVSLHHTEVMTSMQLAGFIAFISILFIMLWSLILVYKKGKLPAAFLMLMPLCITAVEGKLPAARSCWVMIVCAGLFYAVMYCETGKSAFIRSAAAIALMLVSIVFSSAAGARVEAQKEVNKSQYLEIREYIQTTMREVFKNQEESSARKDGENNPQDTAREKEPDVMTADVQMPEMVQEPVISAGGTQAGQRSENKLEDLAEYQPSSGTLSELIVSELPESTVYLPEAYYGAYNHNTWSKMKASDHLMSEEYYEYPNEITRLKALCEKQMTQGTGTGDSEQPLSLQDVSDFIQTEFEQNTVYDYSPGKVPEGKDFAEYFLFDNHKGFCVHFATTATLMYRIFGYPARYVSGHAIPVSAFKKQEDGRYRAEVLTSMGHAWCEVFADKNWQIKEHTLAYEGKDENVPQPAAYKESKIFPIKQIMGAAGVVILALIAAMVILWVRALIRYRRRYSAFKEADGGRGIQNMYLGIYETAVYTGMKETEALSSETFENLKRHYADIPDETWDRIREQVLGSVFYNAVPKRQECDELYQIYRQVSKQAVRKLSGWKKFKYKYIIQTKWQI